MKKIIVPVVCAVISLGVLFPQMAQARLKKIYVPRVDSFEVHDSDAPLEYDSSPQNPLSINPPANPLNWTVSPVDGRAHTGLITPADGEDAVNAGAYPGYYKKAELKAGVNSGVTRFHIFLWVQWVKRKSESNIPASQTDPNAGAPYELQEDTDWMPDPPYTQTPTVNNARALFTWDNPGRKLIGSNLQESTVTRWFRLKQSFRTKVMWQTEGEGGLMGWADVVKVDGQEWLNPPVSWKYNVEAAKAAGTTDWIAITNN